MANFQSFPNNFITKLYYNLFYYFMEQLIALILLILFSPLFLILFFLVKLTSSGPFIFKQKRLGKDKKPFFIYKIRTMIAGAEDQKSKIYHLNEADGPV